MSHAAYHLVVIAVAVWGALRGYRQGLLRQIPAVVAIAFAIVASRLLLPDLSLWMEDWIPQAFNGFNRGFIIASVSATLIFLPFYFVIKLALVPVGMMMKVMPGGIVDNISGAVFRIFKYLMFVSLAYNLIVDFNPRSSLAKSSSSHDGNVVEGVMKMAPALLDFPDGEEVGHYQQLEDARSIS